MSKKDRPSEIVFVRHGESVWNVWGNDEKRKGNPPPEMEGKPDYKTPLTERGVSQAIQTGKQLAEQFEFFDVIYHSPYLRTTQTAELIAEQFPYETRFYRDLLLVEQNFGYLDAGVYPDTEEFMRMQEVFNHLREQVGKFYAKPPNGESWYDVSLRTHDFLSKLFREKWAGKRVLVVSHAVTIATFLYHLHGRDEEDTVEHYQNDKLDNCSVTHFKYNEEENFKWELVSWNNVLWKEKEPNL